MGEERDERGTEKRLGIERGGEGERKGTHRKDTHGESDTRIERARGERSGDLVVRRAKRGLSLYDYSSTKTTHLPEIVAEDTISRLVELCHSRDVLHVLGHA